MSNKFYIEKITEKYESLYDRVLEFGGMPKGSEYLDEAFEYIEREIESSCKSQKALEKIVSRKQCITCEEVLDITQEIRKASQDNEWHLGPFRTYVEARTHDVEDLLQLSLTPPEVQGYTQPTMNCPACGYGYEDFDGIAVIYCEECGYCQHASITNGVCDYCKKEEGNNVYRIRSKN